MKDFAQQKKDIKKNKSVSNITTAGTTETITSETSQILSTGSTGGVTNLVY